MNTLLSIAAVVICVVVLTLVARTLADYDKITVSKCNSEDYEHLNKRA